MTSPLHVSAPTTRTSAACCQATTTTRTRSWVGTSTTITPSSVLSARTRSRWSPSSAASDFPFSHVESGLFAVAIPVTDLADYRLEVSYPGDDDNPTCTPSPIRTGSCRRSARSTCTSSPRDVTNACGRSSAPIRAASPCPTVPSTACPSPYGRRMPRASA